MTTVGAVFLPQFPPERLRSVAEAADEAGLAQLWLWEDCFWEGGIASAAAALAWTERLQLGVGLLPVPLRNVAITAMELTTLHRMFPGRPVIGVGHGVQDWMGQVGARAESPLTLLREYVDALRALLAGEPVTRRAGTCGWTGCSWARRRRRSGGAGRGRGPAHPRLVGGHADGTILTGGTTPAQVVRARERIEAGRAGAGRTGPHPVTVYVLAAGGPDARSRIEREAGRWGWSSSADRAAVGSVDDVAAEVSRWTEAGVDTVVLQPTGDEPDPEGFMAFAADVGRALDR